ncbi:hypothetical protein GH714_001675 [Hevea brasiliensis]|uniref:FBD domain-containing protein n=1 Tax=Hevea brasiliensis TaxID=3981 RepID=A0A6A6KRJ6_HEVBR|nr:hypothetical protein GH714_001675 [Hevea brasiliensis]
MSPLYASHGDWIQKSMSKLLRTVMKGHDANGFCLEQWRSSVKTVLIPRGFNITDENLLYMANRTPNLKRLVVEGSFRITEKGFAEAICDWKKVEHIVLRQVGQQSFLLGSCKRLVNPALNLRHYI